MTQPKWSFWVWFLVTLTACLSVMSATRGNEETSDVRVAIGLDGKFKLGNWCCLFINISSASQPASFEATVPDGHGIPVKFDGPLIMDRPDHYQCWVKVGRSTADIPVEVFDHTGNLITATVIHVQPDGQFSPVPSTVPMMLTIEPGQAVASALKSLEPQLFESRCEIVSVNDAIALPHSWLGYDGIRVIYLTTSDLKLVQAINQQQIKALEDWVQNGGKLVFCSARNAERLFRQSNGLNRLLPGELDRVGKLSSSSMLERYTGSRQPLLQNGDAAIPMTLIRDPDGIEEPANARFPLIIRRSLGFGQIVFATVDFDIAPVNEWPGQRNLLLRATFANPDMRGGATAANGSRSVVRIGYQDLMGQLMLPLESFAQVRFVNFTIVAVLISLFILCIGPGDFFMLRDLFGRMEWTWISFPLVVLGFCALAIAVAAAFKPDEMQINQLEVIDIDSVGNHVRGSLWTNIYSPSNTRCDALSDGPNSLGIDTENSRVSWMGIPGEGLGGMQSRTIATPHERGYRCSLTGSAADPRARLLGLPIGVSSTRLLFTRYDAASPFDIRSRLRLNRSQNRLKGTITNPLDVELRDCRLFFQNWAYILPRPLQPGESVDVASEMQERTATFYFTRRLEGESDKAGGVPWDPRDNNIDRIAEMIMFYSIAQGKQYTGMTHHFQPFIDLSEQLELRRAVLVGRAGDDVTRLQLSCQQQNVTYDQCRTIVRFLLPVRFE